MYSFHLSNSIYPILNIDSFLLEIESTLFLPANFSVVEFQNDEIDETDDLPTDDGLSTFCVFAFLKLFFFEKFEFELVCDYTSEILPIDDELNFLSPPTKLFL